MTGTDVSPEQTIQAVADRLERETVRLEQAHDSRAVFSYSYLRLIQALASAASRDRFADPAWVARLAAIFAERSPLVLIEQVRHPPLWSLRSVFRLSRWIAARLRRWPSHR